MAAINRISGDRSGGVEVPLKGDGRAVSSSGGRGSSFDQTVQVMELEALFKELEDVGTKLSSVPSTVIMSRYRELVRQLLDRALKGVRLRRDLKWRRGDKRGFLVVEQTDAWLEELEQVLFRENNRTRALRLMEDIKGCLISLLF
ncbi:YaaR family protein [Dethiosulfovibrio sp. F2B]|uniref:DUF327 family protein n=1 Tax=Dethiosulfovibrio faecalis TaxID=2720018 RepID=UPI001F2B5808|nr:DUF327 family protein [Dethiosulfovibrio faecalis]MCF4150367.1 YaaR family protein [Dethiosulfovibrio faecalis]